MDMHNPLQWHSDFWPSCTFASCERFSFLYCISLSFEVPYADHIKDFIIGKSEGAANIKATRQKLAIVLKILVKEKFVSLCERISYCVRIYLSLCDVCLRDSVSVCVSVCVMCYV